MKFDQNMLPVSFGGSTRTEFPTLEEAKAFEQWAEETTENDDYPCEAFILRGDDGGWGVSVKRW